MLSRKRLTVIFLSLFLLPGCAAAKSKEENEFQNLRVDQVRSLVKRLTSPQFVPIAGETLYPFSFSFHKVNNNSNIREGKGFILVQGSLWCLVRKWLDKETLALGMRVFIVDRDKKEFVAEFRQWPKGNKRAKWNNWLCIRLDQSESSASDAYYLEWYFPEGTEQRIIPADKWSLYGQFTWLANGLLEKMTSFTNSYVRYYYNGLKITRIEFGKEGLTHTMTSFKY
ncbi:MAG: hypothetical protein JRJ12_08915 [Deltaproteobacteria bacterium]|nr:hypothetical protein [Deltaproteobacteria bacterium]